LEAAKKQLGIKNKLRPAEFQGLRGMCLPMETLDKCEEGQVSDHHCINKSEQMSGSASIRQFKQSVGQRVY